jgi:exo-beta-1,3-glucanase (GH17 family)
MRFTTTLAALAAAALPFTSAYYKGFNVAANNPDGSCKTTAQWTTAFKKLQALPQKINNVRLYASSDCNTLANAVPAAISTGTKILVGVWAEDAAHYTAEKNALEAAIKAHGSSWILAVSVGSEDLYRGDTDANTLANQIYDVRGMVHQWNNVPVGHVDTWTAWVDGANQAVITASDFHGMDGYPYFQNTAIADAATTFWDSVTATKNVAGGKPVMVTETGWPISGPKSGAAVPSLANAKKYWHTVACKAFKEIDIFWYVYMDWNQSPSFGVFGQGGKQLYDLGSC